MWEYGFLSYGKKFRPQVSNLRINSFTKNTEQLASDFYGDRKLEAFAALVANFKGAELCPDTVTRT